MSDDPYFKARDDARAGRSLSPGADESTYFIERQNEAERVRRAAEQEARQKADSGHLVDTLLPPPPPSHQLSPEEARAGLVGCAMTPAIVALAPVYFALYPLVAIAGIGAGYLAWQALSSGGGGFGVGMLVVATFFIAAAIASRVEHTLARSAIYRLLRLPFRALALSVLLLTGLSMAGFGLGCLPPVEPDSLDQLPPFLGTYYRCLLAEPMVLAIVIGAIVLIVVAGRNTALRKRWHQALRALRLHA